MEWARGALEYPVGSLVGKIRTSQRRAGYFGSNGFGHYYPGRIGRGLDTR